MKYPIMIKQMTDKETKEYFLKRLERLCIESKKRGPRWYINPTRKRIYKRQPPFIAWNIEFPGDTQRYDFG